MLGPAYVTRDRLARLFKYRGDMDVEWKSYAPDARVLVTAFVAGVNAYIDEVRAHRSRLPIEFSLLDFLPQRWSVEVPLTRVTSLSESECHDASGSLAFPAVSARSDRVVSNRNKRVCVFIDPRQRLKRGHAGEWAHLGCQRLWIR